MYPEEGIDQFPLLEYAALKEPGGSSLLVSLARGVVIYGRVWRGKPFSNVLFDLVPWGKVQSPLRKQWINRAQTFYFHYVILYVAYVVFYLVEDIHHFVHGVRHLLHGLVGSRGI